MAERSFEYFAIASGSVPDDPEYPVWTRDVRRSTQVVDGKYEEIVPLTFEFVPTLNCMFRCHECAYRAPKERLGLWEKNVFSPEYHMDEATMRVLLDKLKGAGVGEVLFTGGGEPLLDAATPSAMKYARGDLGLRVGLYTNGALIDRRKARAIMEARPDYMRVSLNAGQRDVYMQHHAPLNPVTRRDYFANCQGALDLLAGIKSELGSATVLGVSYLVDPGNAGDVVSAGRLVAALARRHPGMIDYMRFTPSVNYFGPQQHPQELFEAAVDLIRREAVPELTAARVEANVYSHRFSGLYEPRPCDRCLAAGWYGGIGPGGTLYWCCGKLFNPDFAFGSLLRDSFDDLWSGARRAQVRDFVGRAVKGGTDSPCPVVCKPHEHNKVFSRIEALREQGQIDVVRVWLEQIRGIVSSSQKDASPRLYGFQSSATGPVAPKLD